MRKLAVALVLAAALPAAAQVTIDYGASRYKTLYGEPVRVSLWDLAQSPESYETRAVRTKGRLEPSFAAGAGGGRFVLRDFAVGVAVDAVPVPEIGHLTAADVGRMLGSEVEVVGLFRSYGASGGAVTTVGALTFWELTGGEDERAKKVKPAETYALEVLVSQPDRRDGQRVRVVGQFRGANLFGDLPTRSRLRSEDWVLKDDVYAVWVTGRKPKGQGFNLDADLKRDTGKWLDVTGRISSRAGVVYIEAESVALTTAPSPTAEAAPPPPPPERPKVPPVIVFSLPLDGETGVPGNERFVVQFSKDMDEQSFNGRVLLRYAGPVRPGDRGFDGVRLSYDGGRRALTVDPGDRLRPGRVIELILLEGIQDLEGLPLQPRDPDVRRAQGAADVLRWAASGL
jgi:hypothetical protein